MKRIMLIAICIVAVQSRALSQQPSGKDAQPIPPKTTSASPELYAEIAQLDKVLFDAFNSQNLAKLRTMFAPDLEFYQDNEGVASYAQTEKDFGEMFGQAARIRRELVPGSLEVFPIKNYGAMQVGRHRFCHVENGKEECGTFSFVHVWRRTDRGWQIARAISYGH